MKAKPITKPQTRVVRSLHFPTAEDRQIVKAAKLSDQSIAAFIREAASARAAEVMKAA